MEEQARRIAQKVLRDLENPLAYIPVMLAAKAELLRRGHNPEDFTLEHLIYSLVVIRISQEKGRTFPIELVHQVLREVDKIRREPYLGE